MTVTVASVSIVILAAAKFDMPSSSLKTVKTLSATAMFISRHCAAIIYTETSCIDAVEYDDIFYCTRIAVLNSYIYSVSVMCTDEHCKESNRNQQRLEMLQLLCKSDQTKMKITCLIRS